MSKKVFIKTFGCQMNEYDSDKMADVLGAALAECNGNAFVSSRWAPRDQSAPRCLGLAHFRSLSPPRYPELTKGGGRRV